MERQLIAEKIKQEVISAIANRIRLNEGNKEVKDVLLALTKDLGVEVIK